jgi:hypothetical protein
MLKTQRGQSMPITIVRGGSNEMARRLSALAAEIEAAASPDPTPMGRLAHALGLDIRRVAEAVHIARVDVVTRSHLEAAS